MTKRKSIFSCIAWYNKNLRSTKTIIAKQGVFNVEFQQFCKTLDILSLNIYKIYYWCKFSFHWDDKTKDSVISLDKKSANHNDIIPEKENQLINSRKRDHILSFPLEWTPILNSCRNITEKTIVTFSSEVRKCQTDHNEISN